MLGSGSIVAYLGQLLRGQKPCYRLKLMFVGQENVGYTLFRLPPTLQIAHTDRTHTTLTTLTTHSKTSLLRALQRTGQKVKGVSRVVKREDEISRTHASLSSTICSRRLISHPLACCNVVQPPTRPRCRRTGSTSTGGACPWTPNGATMRRRSSSRPGTLQVTSPPLSCACASDTHILSEIGQEIYYATHQFFLSERSLFLVVFNLLSLVQSRVEYW